MVIDRGWVCSSLDFGVDCMLTLLGGGIGTLLPSSLVRQSALRYGDGGGKSQCLLSILASISPCVSSRARLEATELLVSTTFLGVKDHSYQGVLSDLPTHQARAWASLWDNIGGFVIDGGFL